MQICRTSCLQRAPPFGWHAGRRLVAAHRCRGGGKQKLTPFFERGHCCACAMAALPCQTGWSGASCGAAAASALHCANSSEVCAAAAARRICALLACAAGRHACLAAAMSMLQCVRMVITKSAARNLQPGSEGQLQCCVITRRLSRAGRAQYSRQIMCSYCLRNIA